MVKDGIRWIYISDKVDHPFLRENVRNKTAIISLKQCAIVNQGWFCTQRTFRCRLSSIYGCGRFSESKAEWGGSNIDTYRLEAKDILNILQ